MEGLLAMTALEEVQGVSFLPILDIRQTLV